MSHPLSLRRTWLTGLGVLLLGAAGCLPSLNDPDHGPLVSTFAVSDVFTPSGFMGDGAREGFLSIEVNSSNCKPRPPGAHGNCYVFTYYMDASNPQTAWAGVYWVFPANSWGSFPGYAIDSANFHQVHFYAAVETPAGNTRNGGGYCFLNGIAGNIHAGNYGASEHDDVISAMGNFRLGGAVTSDFQSTPFTISLDNQMPATELIGAFAWSIDFPTDTCSCSIPGNSTTECASNMGVLSCPTPVRIYLDDIVWDTTPLPAPDAGAAD